MNVKNHFELTIGYFINNVYSVNKSANSVPLIGSTSLTSVRSNLLNNYISFDIFYYSVPLTMHKELKDSVKAYFKPFLDESTFLQSWLNCRNQRTILKVGGEGVEPGFAFLEFKNQELKEAIDFLVSIVNEE